MTPQSTTHPIKATLRTVVGKQVRQIRNDGQLPAVVYGHGQGTQTLALNHKEFLALYKEAGLSTLVDLTVGDEKPVKALIHDIQIDGPTRKVLHVDFYRVNMKEKLQTEIELEFIGEAPAVEAEGGSLNTVKNTLNVECLPQDLVPSITVDISSLVGLSDLIRIKDITIPEHIEVLDEEDEVIISVTAPRSEEEMAALDEVDATDVTAVESDTTSGTDAAPAEGEEVEAEGEDEAKKEKE